MTGKLNSLQNILVVGGDSFIGKRLCEGFLSRGARVVSTTRHREFVVPGKIKILDLEKDITEFAPPRGGGVAILCAAATSIAACRMESERTRWVNVTQTLKLAKRLKEYGFRLVFLSTSFVFDGKVYRPKPDAPTLPTTEYGRQKLDSEQNLLTLAPETLVIRISKVISSKQPLFQKWVQTLLKGEMIDAFNDYFVAPISVVETCEALSRLILKEASGIWHISPAQELTYFEVARFITKRLGKNDGLVRGVTSRGIIPPEERPSHPALDASDTESFLGMKFSSAEANLRTLFLK